MARKSKSLGLALALILGLPDAAPAQGVRVQGTPGAPVPRATTPAASPSTLTMDVGSGRLISLSGPASNVFVVDPRVAEVRPASPTSLFLLGMAPGRTTIAALDERGSVIGQYEVTVRPSTLVANEAAAAIARVMPGSTVRVVPQPRGLMLAGSVSSPDDAQRAVALAKGYIPEGQVIENQLSVRADTQVTLRVRIVEMSRNVTRDLGINWQALGSVGRFTVAFASKNFLSLPRGSINSLLAGTPDVNALIDALAQDNLVRVLAEPNLTVMSGQTASFLAGGEFPIPVAQSLTQVTVQFKQFGVSLAFQPTVLTEGRISLNVRPEVSQLSNQGAVTLGFGNDRISIPALTVRRAETSVELGSGQSFAIAGLLQDNIAQTNNAVPLFGEVPILGALFRSDSFRRNETELVIIVTPYIARPTSDPAATHQPGDDYRPPNDLERILLLRQQARNSPAPQPRIPGGVGFMLQ
ncbi:hypothetical protein GCM10011504_53630 [Siccirubricoccus deserti]|uniref:Type II and III secretion system protein family protein n=1 Tax=Siccirubricoccus deserti TaxID=2013562 RepID=A0A9X0UGG2_9PROT|nr:type II and III secretion system protein family protein [Siccirubricoccus deserti]MBC4018883.1 type II and III secretion system protein family protein [Siccirubricoccus deserti]GGC68986.1 hypothetical protein GCM10011504_53630 [Siccirubricoccus deserti]